MHKSTYFITGVRFTQLLEKGFWLGILYKLYAKAHAPQQFIKRSYMFVRQKLC